MPSIYRTTYQTVINGKVEYEGEGKERAIRTWDALTLSYPYSVGGIQVQSFDASDIIIRDGWLLHVSETGHVYLNPRI